MSACRLLLLFVCSTAAAVHAAEVLTFAWSGGVTDSSAVVVCQATAASSDVRLTLSLHPDLSDPVHQSAAMTTDAQEIVRFESITGLNPDTTYYYGISVDGTAETVLHDALNGDDPYIGTITTLPRPGEASSFRMVFGACLRTGAVGDEPLFTTMRELQPLFWMCTGDFHYSDIPSNDPDAFRSALRSRLVAEGGGATRLADLSRTTPFVYIWDDHDFGPNDSRGAGKTDSYKQAAHLVYRQFVPYHDLPLAGDTAFVAGEEPIAQAITVGRVRFILTDLRSESTGGDGAGGGTLLGERQTEWFKKELLAANGRHAAVVWLTTVPWNGPSNPKNRGDRWQNLPDTRGAIADFIHEQAIQGFCALSGDMHGVAIDDGSHTDFTTGSQGTGFPLFQAAPLHNQGSYKGGPYSEGAYSGGGAAFGLFEVQDDGDALRVTWTAKDESGDTIIATKDDNGNPITYSMQFAHPLLTSSSPASGAVDVDPGAPLELVFDQPVQAGGAGVCRLRRIDDDQTIATFAMDDPAVHIDGARVSLQPATALPADTPVYVTLDPGAIEDADGHGFAGIGADPALPYHAWRFTTGAGDVPPALPTGLEAEVLRS